MPERVRPSRPSQDRTRDDLARFLIINEDNIDESLLDQTGHFDEAAKRAATASARHRALKLELKELLAQMDHDVRRQLATAGEKVSETQLSNRILLLPRVMDKNREVLAAEREAESWDTLKESFRQRSYLLRELNSSQLGRMANLGVERGQPSARNRAADRAREDQEDLRRERHRPRGRDD